MTGNKFRPDIVERIVELVRTGGTDLRGAIRREYPELTALGTAIRRASYGSGLGQKRFSCVRRA